MIFEAHSTDYQTGEALSALVRDGFGILKVGPGLTFAYREALYALDAVAGFLAPDRGPGLREAMEALMQRSPKHWAKYYGGTPQEQRLQRHFSYSDRIRYYWADPAAAAAVRNLIEVFGDRPIPETLVSQFFGSAFPGLMTGRPLTAPALLRVAVSRVLEDYHQACSMA